MAGTQILDRQGHPYLIRGTELAAVTIQPVRPGDLGALSASALVTIRQRLNMNAVRLPIPAENFERDIRYRERVLEIVRTANRLDLLVILAPLTGPAPDSFWRRLASMFRDNPNVFFAGGTQSSVEAIRGAGAQQPVIVDAEAFPLPGDNIIYGARDRWRQYGTLAGQIGSKIPLVVTGLDPHLAEDSAECAAFPADPAEATRAVQKELAYFDAGGISWLISAFRPGLLITDTRTFSGTRLDDGWTCGQPQQGVVGLGLLLLSHLWDSDPHGLFTVNGDAGNFYLPRGGRATAYGPTLADREMLIKPGEIPPTRMGNVSVRITDSLGISRLAPLLYTGAGWAWINFLIPDSTAPGLAEIAVVRTDGSSSAGTSIIADVAPGLRSGSADGRGPALGLVSQRTAGGAIRTFDSQRCAGYDCRTIPIPLARGIFTTVRLVGTGFRHVSSLRDLTVTVRGVEVPVLSFGPLAGNPGTDQVTIRLTDNLIGVGETDLWMTAAGALSDVVRIHCGGAR